MDFNSFSAMDHHDDFHTHRQTDKNISISLNSHDANLMMVLATLDMDLTLCSNSLSSNFVV